jgi:hypothetical protein
MTTNLNFIGVIALSVTLFSFKEKKTSQTDLVEGSQKFQIETTQLSPAQTKFDVCLSFNGYTGFYFLDRDGSKPECCWYLGKGLIDTVFSLTAGTHAFEISGGYPNAGMNFTVHETGKVTIATNPDAATIKDSVNNGNRIAKIIFNTTNVTIKPNGAFYCISADIKDRVQPYPKYQNNSKPKTFTLIKGLSYMVATGFLSAVIPIGNGKYYIPDHFFFHVDKLGNVSPKDTLLATDICAATYKGNVVSFITKKIKINPADYHTTHLKIDELGTFNKPIKVKLIRGIGTAIKYPTKQDYRTHLIVPY